MGETLALVSCRPKRTKRKTNKKKSEILLARGGQLQEHGGQSLD